MMKRRNATRCWKHSLLAAGIVLACGFPTAASAADVTLFDWAFNVNGITTPGSAPAGFNIAGFDTGTGLGTITATFSTAGSYNVLGFFDHEIDEGINTFYNEFGGTTGAQDVGQSWEIDEPGFVFGDIYVNLLAGALDNANGVPATTPDDVSMALGWNFNLAANQIALLSFRVTDGPPAFGFYLTQTDPDSQYSIYFTSDLAFRPAGQIPEPGSLALLGLGLAALACLRKGRSRD